MRNSNLSRRAISNESAAQQDAHQFGQLGAGPERQYVLRVQEYRNELTAKLLRQPGGFERLA